MDHYHLVVKNESHSFAYVADPTFENFTDGIKKQVNKLINAKVNPPRDGGCSFCPWSVYGIFPFFHRPLTYDEQLLGSISKMLSRVPYLCWMMNIVSSPFLPSPLLREFCSFLPYFGFPQDAPYRWIWHLEMPSPRELPRIGWNFSSCTKKERRWNCIIPLRSTLLYTAVPITSAAQHDPNGN